MSREAEARRAALHFDRVERSKRRRSFDAAVARDYADGLGVRASAARLGCTRKRVEASRAYQGLSGRAAVTDDLLEAQLEFSKRQRRFDDEVARYFAEGLSVSETSGRMNCGTWEVQASRAWLGISTGRSSYRSGIRTGRLGTKAAIEGMRIMFRMRRWVDSELSL